MAQPTCSRGSWYVMCNNRTQICHLNKNVKNKAVVKKSSNFSMLQTLTICYMCTRAYGVCACVLGCVWCVEVYVEYRYTVLALGLKPLTREATTYPLLLG